MHIALDILFAEASDPESTRRTLRNVRDFFTAQDFSHADRLEASIEYAGRARAGFLNHNSAMGG